MSDKSDYLCSHRFDTDLNLFDFQNETLPDGTELRYANKRLGLLRSDIYTGIEQISEDRLRELVKTFKENSITEDDENFNKLKVASRQILYAQLSEAYTFGLACFSSLHNHQSLVAVMGDYGLHKHIKALTHIGRYNKWNAITALLYGEWEQGHYKRERSAEKYGCVLAMLERKKVKVADVVSFINKYAFKEKHTNKQLKGIIALETHYRSLRSGGKKSGGPSSKQIAIRNQLIARGENPSLNDDVFEMPKPTQLPDAFEFGRVVVKRIGDEQLGHKLLVVGYETWEQAQYEKHAYSRGKSAYEDEKQVQAVADAAAKEQSDKAESVATNIKQAAIIQQALAAGVDAQSLLDTILGAVGKLTEVKVNSNNLTNFADLDPA
jgi:hypothetical protein